VPESYQIRLSEDETIKLINRIEQDVNDAQSAHAERRIRFAKHMQRWENRVDPPKKGDESKPNHTVPLVQWSCFNKLARSLQSLLGDDADITARPTGPSDQAKVAKIGAYMRSRLFDQMEITEPLIVHLFRTILHGRSVFERAWIRKEFEVIENGKRQQVCYYEGPDFDPIHPDDLLTPAERGVTSIQKFSFAIRRRRYTVDELRRGDGTLFQGTNTPEFVERAIRWAKDGGRANDWLHGDQLTRQESETAEGVNNEHPNEGARSLWVYEWYGAWRPQGKGKKIPFEAEWKVCYVPGMRKIIGVQDLVELYPKMKNRRPFGEASLIKDGTYWSKGFGDLLGDIEDEATSNSRLFTAAGELAVWPIVFFKPGSGMKPGMFRIEPGTAIPTEDPGGVNVVTINPNLNYAIAKNQDTLANAERVGGISDSSMGRSIERPNAPRTATGQLALIEEGNVRVYLDSTVLKTDMERFLQDVWDMDSDLAPKSDPGIFFRVTEEQAKGLFDVNKGGSFMQAKEFGGRYDFRLKFATSAYAREAQAQKVITFYQAAVMNPLVATNPKALWVLLNKLAKALGIDDFSSITPEPPDLDTPLKPEAEWTKMLEGEEVEPNPQDDDQYHLMAHAKQFKDALQGESPDKQAIHLLIAHQGKHREQMRTKQLMQGMVSELMNELASNQAGMDPAVNQMLGRAVGAPQMQTEQPGQAPGQNVGSSAAPQPQGGML
jgi:hypothetical protein